MLRRTMLWVALLLAIDLGAGATAHAKPTIAVLGLEVLDSGDGINERDAAFAAHLTKSLRHRAMLGKGAYSLAPNSAKELLELKLLSDCADEAAECMASIGKEMHAARLMYGKVERRDGGYQVSLALLDVDAQAMERTLSEIVPFDATDDEGLRGWARTLYNRITGTPDSGALAIRANASRGVVFIDDTIKTTLSNGAASVQGLSEGAHALRVEARGYETYQGTIEVTSGETLDVTVALAQSAGGPGAVRPGRASRVLFWSSVIATGAGVTAFTITGLQKRSFEDQKLKHFQTLIDNGADTTGAEVDGKGNYIDVCAIAARNPHVTGSRELTHACDAGRSRALVTNILVGASVATALAASYFYYKGYIQPARANEKHRRITVTPTMSPHIVGAEVEIQF